MSFLDALEPKSVLVDAGNDGVNVVVAADSQKRFYITAVQLTTVSAAASVVTIEDTDNTVLAKYNFPANGGISGPIVIPVPKGKGIQVRNPATVDTFGVISFKEKV